MLKKSALFLALVATVLFSTISLTLCHEKACKNQEIFEKAA
jgi:hypothetical protein